MDPTLAVSVGALLTANLTNDPGPGLWAGIEARVGAISVGLEARAVLPSNVTKRQYDFDMSQGLGLLVGCYRYWWLMGCAVVGAGAQVFHDSEHAFLDGHTLTYQLVQIGVRAGLDVPFGDTGLGARGWAEGLYSASPAFVYFDARTSGYTQPPLSAFFGAGLWWKFDAPQPH